MTIEDLQLEPGAARELFQAQLKRRTGSLDSPAERPRAAAIWRGSSPC